MAVDIACIYGFLRSLVDQCIATVITSGQMLVDQVNQRAFGHCTDHAIFLLAIPEHKYSRNAPDPELGRDGRRVVGVDLAADYLSGVFLGHFREHRRNHPARTAPRRPELHQYRLLAFRDQGVPVGLARRQHCAWSCKCMHSLADHKASPAVSTDRTHRGHQRSD